MIPTQKPSPLAELERDVNERSAVLKKELGLFDLVLTQIVFVVGTIWVGWAAKLGDHQMVFWLLAILTFYLPLAAVVIFLNRLMPLEGGVYQWAKLAFNDFVAFMRGLEPLDLWHPGHVRHWTDHQEEHCLRHWTTRRLDA